MRENLHRFLRAARGAGVRVSPAESIDAMRAVAQVGFTDRGILRDTFLLTLAKTQDEKRALGDCFDLFFSQPDSAQETAQDEKTDDPEKTGSDAASDSRADAGNENIGPLAQMLLSQDRNALAAAIANASGAASLSDIRYFTQRGIFSGRKPAQRNPAQRAARPDRAAAGRADAGADPPDRPSPARALLKAAQAPAPRSSRRAAHFTEKRRLG
jgi:uncharacterized protein with von Willebrand factor type A (vWA) domain